MSTGPDGQPAFQITHETEPSKYTVAGLSSFGLAGLTAVDFLTDQLGLEETGYISTDALPAITPFSDGTPRHHTRLFSRPGLEITFLLNELFVPLWAADTFAKAILGWADANPVTEITILAGVPSEHASLAERVFYVATEDYQGDRLAGTGIGPMENGFLDGVNASLMGRGMDSSLRVGLFATPVRDRVPDVEAAIRLVEAVERMYGIDVDTHELEEFAGEVEQYYRDLERRFDAPVPRGPPEDRTYM